MATCFGHFIYFFLKKNLSSDTPLKGRSANQFPLQQPSCSTSLKETDTKDRPRLGVRVRNLSFSMGLISQLSVVFFFFVPRPDVNPLDFLLRVHLAEKKVPLVPFLHSASQDPLLQGMTFPYFLHTAKTKGRNLRVV